jgi:hypothetical protein
MSASDGENDDRVDCQVESSVGLDHSHFGMIGATIATNRAIQGERVASEIGGIAHVRSQPCGRQTPSGELTGSSQRLKVSFCDFFLASDGMQTAQLQLIC